jgi:Rieske Fe-S protein
MTNTEESHKYRCSRRDFIKNAMTGVGTIAIGSFSVSLLEGCKSPGSKMTGSHGSVTPKQNEAAIIVDTSKAENQTLAKIGGTLALGASDVDDKGILLYRENETTVKAYSRECTHEQCTVGPFINGVSSCPCHGSRFNLSGGKVSGPAPMPLRQYTTSVNGNIITIKA